MSKRKVKFYALFCYPTGEGFPQHADAKWSVANRTSWAWLDERLASDLYVERLLHSVYIRMLRRAANGEENEARI
jgi:hypothetical protein